MKLKSSEPFWLIKNGLLNTYPSLREDISTDILIVGGGITGSLIAHQCIEDGYKSMLIDRCEIANGSTSATTSMLQYEIDVPLYKLIKQIGEKAAIESYQACFDSIDNLAKVIEKIKSDCGFKKKDSLYYAAYKKDVKWLKQEYEVRKKHGFPVKWVESTEIKDEYNLKNTFGGILSNQGASIDAFQLTHDLLEFNCKRGLSIYDKTELVSTKYSPDTVELTTRYGNKITAKKVIYCTGYESVELIKDDFVKLHSTYAMVGEVHQEKKPLNNLLVWDTADPYIYMRTTDDGRILIGGGDEDFVNASIRDSLIKEKSKNLEKKLSKLFSNYEFRTDFSWAGTFGTTQDGLPYIGEHPDFQNTYFVLGFGGNGITFSVVGMDMVSENLKNKKHHLSEYFKFRR